MRVELGRPIGRLRDPETGAREAPPAGPVAPGDSPLALYYDNRVHLDRALEVRAFFDVYH